MNQVRVARDRPQWQRVVPPKHPVLFVNPRSGGGTAARLSLDHRARELGITPMPIAPAEALVELAERAVEDGADALGVAGGDGSLATVAGIAAAHDLPFACIPAGTRNHFARDVGVLRRDVVGALEAFTDGVERRVDLGDVNGLPFVDNVILGFYADAIRREGYRDARVRTLLEVARDALGPQAPASGLVAVDDEGREHRDPAVILCSNNPYALDRGVARDTRPRLDGGQLGMVILDRPSPAPARRISTAWAAPTLEVQARAPVHAGLDGEAVTLVPPLRYHIRPLALRVRIAARHPGASPSEQIRALDPRRRR